MKIRQGFVSNSSSSSFVCVACKKDFFKGLQSLTTSERDSFDVVFNDKYKVHKLGQEDIVIHTGHRYSEIFVECDYSSFDPETKKAFLASDSEYNNEEAWDCCEAYDWLDEQFQEAIHKLEAAGVIIERDGY